MDLLKNVEPGKQVLQIQVHTLLALKDRQVYLIIKKFAEVADSSRGPIKNVAPEKQLFPIQAL